MSEQKVLELEVCEDEGVFVLRTNFKTVTATSATLVDKLRALLDANNVAENAEVQSNGTDMIMEIGKSMLIDMFAGNPPKGG